MSENSFGSVSGSLQMFQERERLGSLERYLFIAQSLIFNLPSYQGLTLWCLLGEASLVPRCLSFLLC